VTDAEKIKKFQEYLLEEAEEAKRSRNTQCPNHDETDWEFYDGRRMAFLEAYGAFLVMFREEK